MSEKNNQNLIKSIVFARLSSVGKTKPTRKKIDHEIMSEAISL